MPSLKMQQFLNEVLSYIKFSFDRDDIQSELEDHISEKMDYYIEQGYDLDTAEELSVKDMGDAKEIGVELNKQHNPIIGWIWKVSNVLVVLFAMIIVYFIMTSFAYWIFSGNLANDVPKSQILYQMKIDEKVQIDDRVIHFTKIIYEKNGDMNIFYKDYDKKLLGKGWSFSSIGTISDNLGNTYVEVSGHSIGGIITKSHETVQNFSSNADTLIINYDRYNRRYRVEIPLKVGVHHE